LFDRSVEDLKGKGAEVVDPVAIPEMERND
jgi:hypothetical protein